MLAKFAKAGIHIEALGDQLRVEGAPSLVKSWNELPQCIASKSEALKAAWTQGGTMRAANRSRPSLIPAGRNTGLEAIC